MRFERGLLPEVDRGRLAVRKPNHHETATADVPGGWMRHRQGEARRDRGVDGVATRGENVCAYLARDPLLRRDHSAARANGLSRL